MIKIWLIRPTPHYTPRIREFLSENIVAIGWPELDSLAGKTKADIKTLLKPHPLNYSPTQLGAATSTVDSFVNEIRIDDIVVVPNNADIYFCRIVSNYYYDQTKASQTEGYPHQRKVDWLTGPIKRDAIPDALRQSLRAPRTLADLTHHAAIILDFIKKSAVIPQANDLSKESNDKEANEDYVEYEYPLRLDIKAVIRIPKNITQEEATRLGDFVRTLYFG